jgi:hypothetical protein
MFTHIAIWNRSDKKWIPGVAAGMVAVLLATLVSQGIANIAVALLALLPVALFAGALVPWMVQRLPQELDGMAIRRKITTTLLVLLGIVSVVQTSRLSTFMGDANRAEFSLLPSDSFIVHHSCLTAYVEAARLTTEGDKNIYDAENWPDLSQSARSETYQKRYAPFGLDAFAYPPPYLLLPRFLLLTLHDFRAQRALWFGLNGLLLAFGLWTVATWIGGKQMLRPLLMAPLVFGSLATILTLQIGNVHAAVMVLAMLAMVAFESDRPALGGAMLAFAIASKISPGLLVVVLLFQRRYREIVWTAGFGLAFVLLSLIVVGTAPFEAFLVYQLPLLSSGKALSFLARSDSVPFNVAPFGIPFKLAFLGINVGDPWKLAKIINQGFTVLVVVLTILAARKKGPREMQAAVWLTVLTLGTLRSPYAPPYVLFPLLWLFSLWAIEVRNAIGTILIAVCWFMFSVPVPLSPTQNMIFTLFHQAVIVGILVYWVLRKAPHESNSPTTAIAT